MPILLSPVVIESTAVEPIPMFEVAVVVASLKSPRDEVSPVRLEPSPSLLSSVPVASGSVIVLSVLVLGAVSVSIPVPLACP